MGMIRQKILNLRHQINGYQKRIDKLDEEQYKLTNQIGKLKDSCPHISTTTHAGSLTHQRWVECDECNHILRRGWDAFEGKPDIRHKGGGN